MPTILRKDGFSVRIYTNDHLPSHVHVIKTDGEAKINLGSQTERPTLLRVSEKMSDRDAAKALQLVSDNQEYFLAKWREIHEQSKFD